MLQDVCSIKWHWLKVVPGWLGISLALFSLLTAGCQQAAPPPPLQPATAAVRVVEPTDLAELQNLFKTHRYDWDRLEAGVPPLIVTRFPEDLDHRLPSDEKKRVFLLSLLPMVLMANQAIEAERQEVENLFTRYDASGSLPGEELQRLQALTGYYKLPGDPLTDRIARAILLHRVDIIPPALVLAQAATESGWGTSRFVREGNNLFGQRTYWAGNGIVPAQRRTGETHEVKRFGTLFESVRSYMRNLNTHEAYRELRDVRANLRRSSQPLNGIQLARGLSAYSTRADDYIADVRNLIRSNDLTRTNQSFLRSSTHDPSPTIMPSVEVLLASSAFTAETASR